MLGNEALTTRTYVVNMVMFVYLFAIAMGTRRGYLHRAFGGGEENKSCLFVGQVCNAYFYFSVAGTFLYLGFDGAHAL